MIEQKPPLRVDAQRNYELLLRTAEKVFVKSGPGVALDVIAKQAGVGIGTLYRHFPNRDSLLQAVYAPRLSAVIARASALLTTPPDKALSEWLRMIVRFSEEYTGFSSVIRQASTDSNSELAQAGSRLLDSAQQAHSIRSDITIADILRLVSALTNDMTKEEVKRVDSLIEVIVSGLRYRDHA